MRVLFSFAGGNGHLYPLIPIARAAQDAGHTVAVTGRSALTPAIEALGFTACPTGARSDGPPDRTPLLEPDADREDRVLRDYFAGRLARNRATLLIELCGTWRPDVIVCDEADFGAMIAAELLGLPYANVVVMAAGSFVREKLVTEPLNALRAEHGLPDDPDLVMLRRHLVLAPVPPSFRDPAFPLPTTGHPIRPVPLAPARGETPPPWFDRLDSASTVYFSLGTEFNTESGDLFNRVLAGLADLPIELIMTVGSEIDPAEFGPQPVNVHIERFVPQSLILPHCAVIVSHGGSGSVIGALSHGVPMVLIPLGADQPMNAARCEKLGVGRTLDPVWATPADARKAVASLLTVPHWRRNAERIRDEISALPDPTRAIPLLENLASASQHVGRREARPTP